MRLSLPASSGTPQRRCNGLEAQTVGQTEPPEPGKDVALQHVALRLHVRESRTNKQPDGAPQCGHIILGHYANIYCQGPSRNIIVQRSYRIDSGMGGALPVVFYQPVTWQPNEVNSAG